MTTTIEEIKIRTIEEKDNAALANVIRSTLKEFGANKPGTVYYDESTDHLSAVFTEKGSCYFVVIADGVLVGGAGIFPTENLPLQTCELVKIYLAPVARGKGIGKMLMQHCEETAIKMGYKNIYLETMPELRIAVPMYEKMGYQYLTHPLGNSGHTGCAIWMLKKV